MNDPPFDSHYYVYDLSRVILKGCHSANVLSYSQMCSEMSVKFLCVFLHRHQSSLIGSSIP